MSSAIATDKPDLWRAEELGAREEDAHSFTPEDQPGRLAEEIAKFAAG